MSLSDTQIRLVQIMVDRGCKVEMTPERVVSGLPAKPSTEITSANDKQAWMVNQGLAQCVKALEFDRNSVAGFIKTLEGVSIPFARSALKGYEFGVGGYPAGRAKDSTVRRAVEELIRILKDLPPEGTDEAS